MFEVKRGTNISHWLSQSKDRGEVREKKFTRDDMKRIADWGLDHIRLPFDEEQMWNREGKADGEAFELLGNALEWARGENLRVIADLHIIKSHYFNDHDEPPLFTDPRAPEQFARLWGDLSDFMGDYDTDFLAYELLNEAVARDREDWNRVYRFPYELLREREPERTIVLGSNWFNQYQTFPHLAIPKGDRNLILTFHYYNPMFITHWNAPWWRQGGSYDGPIEYPGFPIPLEEKEANRALVAAGATVDNRYYDKSVMKSDISIPWNVARAHGLPLHCGEFGVREGVPREIRLAWYRDLRSLFEEFDIGWSNWDYRGGFGLLNARGEESEAFTGLLA